MATSEHSDREWRRVKPTKRRSWAKALLRPQVWSGLVLVGRAVAQVLWLVYRIYEVLRE